MKTCVLCFSRRNAFEWTIRSRSRWNGVRSGESSSGWARRAGYERDAGDRHPERRAAHVVESRHLEELDRLGIAPVLAADPQLEIGLRLASGPRGQPDEPPHAEPVDRVEGAAVEDASLYVALEEPALHVVA